MVETDNITYNLNEVNYHDTETIKTQIVLGRSLRKKNYHIRRLQHKNFGKTTKWNTYTISRTGVLFFSRNSFQYCLQSITHSFFLS